VAEPKHISAILNVDEMFTTIEKTRPEFAADLRQRYLQGYEDGLNRRETESSLDSNSLSSRDTASRKRSGLPALSTMIPPDSPLRTAATKSEIMAVVLRIGLATGHTVSKDRQMMLVDLVEKAGWTTQEIEYAETAILTDKGLLKNISFERTIGPGVFAEARETAAVVRGRLLTKDEAAEYTVRIAPKNHRGDLVDDPKPVSVLFETVRFSEKPSEIRWWLR
jgi:hypothetical protein